MIISILKAEQLRQFDTGLLLLLESYNRNKEILGQLTADKNARTIDPNRISHIIKNINYNKLTQALECKIECLSTPYGQQLKRLLDHHPRKIKFISVYAFENDSTIKLYTVNAVIVEDKK